MLVVSKYGKTIIIAISEMSVKRSLFLIVVELSL